MRQLLEKLACSDYPTLVAASSVIRPGVSQSGMMEEYIKRHHNPGNYECVHPIMKALLPDTYGLMIYQEDVIKVCLEFAGLDAGKCDIIRRGMSGKARGYDVFLRVQADFFDCAKAKGHSLGVIQEVWRQVSSFGGYSFSKAHSASFAVESYQSLHLKTYFPMEFMVSVIKNFGGFYSRELYFHELKRTGARVHPPCVNHSDHMTNIHGADVYVGFIHIQSLQENCSSRITEERGRGGPFLHLLDFIERTQPALEQLNLLIRVDAFRFTGKEKPALLWEAAYLMRHNKKHSAGELFQEDPPSFDLPHLVHNKFDYMVDQIELLGFTLGNVFDMVDHELNTTVKAKELPLYVGKEVDILVYLIIIKDTWTKHNQLMHFATFLDEAGDWMDTVHFPDVTATYPLTGKGFYKIRGKVTVSFGVHSIEAHSCEKIGIKESLNKVVDILKADQSYRQIA
jgi:DNA polymerase-3 subunit alpha